MTNLKALSQSLTMGSVELVDLINVVRKEENPENSALRHDHFMAKVAKVLGEEAAPNFRGSYTGEDNTVRPCYFLPKREAFLMVMSESYKLQAKVYDRWQELEAQQAPTVPITYIEALKALLIAEEAKEDAIRTKAEIGSRREATAMNAASQLSKQVTKLEIELDKSKEFSSIKRMEMLHHGVKFNWRLLKSASQDIGIELIEIFDANYGTVKAYHRDAWIEAYALDIEV
jgi:hypothetical protein